MFGMGRTKDSPAKAPEQLLDPTSEGARMRQADVEYDDVTGFGVQMKRLAALFVRRPMGARLDPQAPAITMGLEVDCHLVDLTILSGKVVTREVGLGLTAVLMPATEAVLCYVTMASEEDVFGPERCPK